MGVWRKMQHDFLRGLLFFLGGVEGSLARAFAKMLGKVKVFFSSCLWIADWGREKECFVDSRRRPNSLSPFLSGSVMLVVFSALFFFGERQCCAFA